MEIWTQLLYENKIYLHYFVSNLGRIKNKFGTIIQQRKDKDGYWRVSIIKGYRVLVHNLVFSSFNPQIKKNRKWAIDHIDNNRLNNNLENLQYITARENTSKDKNRDLPTGVSITTEKCRAKQYYADIRINGKKKFIGRYHTKTEARLAYLKELVSIGEFKKVA